MNDDQVVETPVDESTNVDNEPTLTNESEVQDDQVVETQEQGEVEETPVSDADSVPESTVEADEDEENYTFYSPTIPEAPNVPSFDPSQMAVDEDGNIDVNALADAINNHVANAVQASTQSAAGMVRELEERRVEEAQWQKAREKYPELKTDKQLAQEVNALRYGMFMSDIQGGKADAKMLTVAQAMERFNKRMTSSRADGIKQATENVRVQESAYIQPTSNAKSVSQSDEDSLFQKMRSPIKSEAEAAQAAILRNRLFGDN